MRPPLLIKKLNKSFNDDVYLHEYDKQYLMMMKNILTIIVN